MGEGDEGDLGGAVEAEGDADGADAAVDVELHLVEAEEASDVLAAEGWEDKGAEDGEADLAAVGVAGEHKGDEAAAGVADDVVGVVGGVGHEDAGGVGLGGQGLVEVGDVGAGVGGATDIEAVAGALDGDEVVAEDGNAVLLEGGGDEGAANGDVVVAEDGVTLRTFEGDEDLGAAAGGVAAEGKGERAAGDEVAGEQDEVGVELVDDVDDALEEEGLGVLVEVDIAELGDAHAGKGAGQGGDGNGEVGDGELVAGDLAAVEGKPGGDGAGTDEEAAPREVGRLPRWVVGHSVMIRGRLGEAGVEGSSVRWASMSYAARRRRALERVGEAGLGALLVGAQPDVRYLTGFTGSAGALVLGRGGSCLFTDGRYTEQAKAETKGVPVRIERRPAMLAAVAWVREMGVPRCGFEATQTTVAALDGMRKSVRGGRAMLRPVNALVARLREIKDVGEIETMRAAAAIGDRLFAMMLERLRPGVTEVAMAEVLEREARRLGAEGMSFETIVASGERSALPHGRASEAKLPRRGFVTLDFGVIYKGYCSDMTRTVHLGRPDPAGRDVYHSVLEAQLAAIRVTRAGLAAAEVDRAAREVLDQAGVGEFFTHSTGHGVGLEIHEGPRLAMQQTQVLEKGMVITIEPGVYLSGRFGVRIEDMLLVTTKGSEVLTASTKALIEL